MPPARRPARRQLKSLGSLQLLEYANNPSKVITELAFITDARTRNPEEDSQSDPDVPLEVQFNELMEGVNSRGKGTGTRQRKMTVEQAAGILLLTVQKGHVELIVDKNDPNTIDAIRILPGAKKTLASFLPKLRGYYDNGDIPYNEQYRGAIALAKRHFFPKGQAPTKKELMALLLQSYQERRELRSQRQARPLRTSTLGIQTSLRFIDGSSSSGAVSNEVVSGSGVDSTSPDSAGILSEDRSQNNTEPPDNDIMVDIESTAVVSDGEPDLTSCTPFESSLYAQGLGDGDDHYNTYSESEAYPAQMITQTPAAPRSFNPYMTPESNPRKGGHLTSALSTFNVPLTPTLNIRNETASDGGAMEKGIGELLQDTATSQGRLNYWYKKFMIACRENIFLKEQKEEIEKEYDLTKRRLDETEQRLREANVDRDKLKKWVVKLRRTVNGFCAQLGALGGMDLGSLDDGEVSADDPGCQEGV